jgi:hypothetical protein
VTRGTRDRFHPLFLSPIPPPRARDASWASFPRALAGPSRSATLEAAMSDSETETEAPRRSQRERKQAKPFQSGPSTHTTRFQRGVLTRVCSWSDKRRKEETWRRLGLGCAGLERRLRGRGRRRVGRRGRRGGGRRGIHLQGREAKGHATPAEEEGGDGRRRRARTQAARKGGRHPGEAARCAPGPEEGHRGGGRRGWCRTREGAAYQWGQRALQSVLSLYAACWALTQ